VSRNRPLANAASTDAATDWIAYHFTLLRIVPHVQTAAFANIGVVLHARTAEFLGMRAITDAATLRIIAPDVDVDLLVRYLTCYEGICAGDVRAGPIALLSRSERFHWISSPRSDVLQSSPVHEGICTEPQRALDDLFLTILTGREGE
jgi:hypothetical protein